MTIGDNDIIEKFVQLLGDANIRSFVCVSPFIGLVMLTEWVVKVQ
jgi:hypothetical protein